MASPQSWFYIVFVLICGFEWCIVPICGTPDPSATVVPSVPVMEDASANVMSEQLVISDESSRRGRQHEDCKIVNVSETYLGLQEVGGVASEESHKFFVRPKPTFRRLVLRVQLKSVLELSGSFYTEEAIDLHSTDLEHAEPEPWTEVEVEHYEYISRGFNSHGLRVSVGKTKLSLVTDYWWVFYTYEGFVVYAEGGTQVLFNCLPETLKENLSSKPFFNGAWLMVGLLTVAATLLTVLFSVWLSRTCRRTPQTNSQPPQNVVYEDFDEEVLNNIRQKVEALRSGKSREDLTGCPKYVACYQHRTENPYEMDPPHHKAGNQSMAPRKQGINKKVDSDSHQHNENPLYSVRAIPDVTEVRDAPVDSMGHYPHVDYCEANVKENTYENLNFYKTQQKEMVVDYCDEKQFTR